jgi:hypothetical protein
MFPHGALEAYNPESNRTFMVNGHRVKPYFETKLLPRDEDLALQSVQDVEAQRALESQLVEFKCTFPKK